MTKFKVETHNIHVRHIVIDAKDENEAKELAANYVDKKSHIVPNITYDNRLKKIKNCTEIDWQSVVSGIYYGNVFGTKVSTFGIFTIRTI